jgi:hypothetical protein
MTGQHEVLSLGECENRAEQDTTGIQAFMAGECRLLQTKEWVGYQRDVSRLWNAGTRAMLQLRGGKWQKATGTVEVFPSEGKFFSANISYF